MSWYHALRGPSPSTPPDGQNSQAIFRGRQVRTKKTPGRTQSTKKQMPLSVRKSPGEIYNTKNKMPKGRPKTLWHVRKMPGAHGMISGRVIKPRPKIPRVSLILTICTKIARMGFSDRSLGISGQVMGDFRTGQKGGFHVRILSPEEAPQAKRLKKMQMAIMTLSMASAGAEADAGANATCQHDPLKGSRQHHSGSYRAQIQIACAQGM